MKKLFSLAMAAVIAVVIMGCQKSDEQKASEAAGGVTNAMPK